MANSLCATSSILLTILIFDIILECLLSTPSGLIGGHQTERPLKRHGAYQELGPLRDLKRNSRVALSISNKAWAKSQLWGRASIPNSLALLRASVPPMAGDIKMNPFPHPFKSIPLEGRSSQSSTAKEPRPSQLLSDVASSKVMCALQIFIT